MIYIGFIIALIIMTTIYALCVVSSKSDDEMNKITEIEERNDY